jgi:hypothetical protein
MLNLANFEGGNPVIKVFEVDAGHLTIGVRETIDLLL